MHVVSSYRSRSRRTVRFPRRSRGGASLECSISTRVITSTLHTVLAKALVCDCSRVSGLRKSFNIARRGPGVLLGITRRGSAVEELQTCRWILRIDVDQEALSWGVRP